MDFFVFGNIYILLYSLGGRFFSRHLQADYLTNMRKKLEEERKKYLCSPIFSGYTFLNFRTLKSMRLLQSVLM